jgi:hypothetical protein
MLAWNHLKKDIKFKTTRVWIEARSQQESLQLDPTTVKNYTKEALD